MPPDLLDTRELADRLGTRPAEILEWVHTGIIPGIKVGRRYVFNLASVVEAIRRHRKEASELVEAGSC